MSNPRIIAFYLPQFHPFKENDEWWGKGFTEWTNVGKAKKLFRGHQQPKVPADLGYYDLRLPEVREQQAELAREAGIEGFCYWHYWFGGKGRQLLNNIIDEVHATGKPSLPFCLGWANETWKSKQWNKDGKGDILLMEQRYEGEEDFRAHYEYVRELFKDERYIRVDDCPFFYIYRPLDSLDNIKQMMALWNKWVKEDGIADKIYFVGNIDIWSNENEIVKQAGFDALSIGNYDRRFYYFNHRPRWIRALDRLKHLIVKRPLIFSYKKMNSKMWIPEIDSREYVIPHLLPNWDHTPRSGLRGVVLQGSTPKLFQEQATEVLSNVMQKSNKLVMLKSWNEWAEGNYMEPDLKYGKGYIKALKEAIEKL